MAPRDADDENGQDDEKGEAEAGGGVDLSALCRAMSTASYSLRAFRENRAAAVREYTGQNYSENARDTPKQMVNLLAMYVRIVGKKLISNQPRFLYTTFNKRAGPSVSKMQFWANQEVERMDLAEVLQRAVVDALFSVGVVKVALTDAGHSATKGWTVPAGTAFADVVDLDDFVYDVHARTFRDASFVGHRYRMPLRVAREMREFDKKQRENLTASQDPRYTPQGDERIDSLGRAYTGDATEFEDMVDLWEVYLPRHKLIVTLEHDAISSAHDVGSYGEALRTQEWVGPDCGPYHFLGFDVVPNNAMPKSPIQDLQPMNSLVNNIWRKLDRQARNFKIVTGIRSAADADGNRLLRASDGEAVKVDDPEAIREIMLRMPHPALFGLANSAKDLFNWMGGNMELVGGLSAQSRTATQDKMLNENSSGAVSDLQQITTRFVASVGKALAWYWWHDPFKVMRMSQAMPGLPPDLAMRRTLGPEDRIQVPWDDLAVRVDPFSLPFQSPGQRLQLLNSVLQQVLPLVPILQQQGIMIDMNYYLRKVGEYADSPDITGMFTLQAPPQTPPEQGGDQQQPGLLEGAGMAPETTRNYVRRSMGGGNGTAGQNENAMMNAASQMSAQLAPSSNGQG